MKVDLNDITMTLKQWAYPLRCPVCHDIVPYEDVALGICHACVQAIPLIRGSRCFCCGRKLLVETDEYCLDCQKTRPFHVYDRGLALCSYDELMRACVYRLKYGHRGEYGMSLGRLMGRYFYKSLTRLDADGIVAVPLHPKRQKKRGYNQAELLAKGVSKVTGIPYYEGYILRQKNTLPSKDLNPVQRQNNLKNAFKVRQNVVKLNITIVIDDIYTTGSTIDAVCRALKRAGTKRVYFLVLAIGEDN